MRIDHVIYGTSDLDAAAAAVEAAIGAAAVPGGRHEGLGTCNRIVPLGGGYIELLAVADAAEAGGSDLGRALMRRIEAGDGLLGWAATVDDVAPVAERLGLAVTTIRREGFAAHLCGVAEAMAEPWLPFFIARDVGVPGPPPPGSGPAIEWLALSGDEARLAHWLDGAPLPLRLVDGPPGVRAVGVGGRELRA